jgi:CBS-domain-containing membrane protein
MYVRDAMLETPLETTEDEALGTLLPRLIASRQATAAVLDARRHLVGVIGVHDILRRIVPIYVDLDEKLVELMHANYLEERAVRLRSTRVRDLMTRAIDTVAPGDSLIKAAVLIVEKRRKTLPVVDHGRFVGMITRRTLLETIAPSLVP